MIYLANLRDQSANWCIAPSLVRCTASICGSEVYAVDAIDSDARIDPIAFFL